MQHTDNWHELEHLLSENEVMGSSLNKGHW